MPDATARIGGDASGAVAAVATAQGAINSLTGKTVVAHVIVRQSGGSVAGMAADMGRVGNAADRAGRSARGMGENFDRAGRSARGMGDHVGRAADEAGRFRTHMDAVNNIMGGGAAGAVTHAQGMRSLANEAARVKSSIGEIGSGSGGMRAIEAGVSGAGRGFRAMGAAARGTSAEVIGVYRNTRQAITAAGEAGSAFSTAAGHTSQMGTDLARTGRNAGEAGSELARVGEKSSELARQNRSLAGSFANNPMLKSMMGWMGSLDNAMGRAGSAVGGVGSALGNMGDAAMPSGRALQGVGLAGGVAALGMGALTAAVAGVGLAGVAEDFAHNAQLMHAGEQAVRGFNKAFSAMRSETSAAGMPQMAGVAASMKGVGHELATIGAQNIGPVLKDVSALGNQAAAAMKQLEPAIGPATQAVTAVGSAIIGAFGNAGPAVTSFADKVTANAPQIQSFLEGAIKTAAVVGGALVETGAGMANFDAGVGSPSGKPPGSAVDPSGRHPSFAGMAQAGLMTALGGPLVPLFGAAGAVKDMITGGEGAPGGAPAPATAGQKALFGGGTTPARSGRGDFSSTGEQGLPRVPPGTTGTGAEALTQQRAAIGLPPVGQPMYSGVGPRGPGQSVGAMPARIAPSLGMGSIAPLNDLNQAMQSQVAGGGAQTGSAMVQHIQKAVQVAAPAASSGGASIGAAMNSGTAQGSQSSQSVIDTVIIKHSKHIIDIASAALGIHSPSEEFDRLGRMTWAGFGQGAAAEAPRTFGAMSSHMGGVLGAAQTGAHKFGYDYQDESAPVSVSVRKPMTPEEYQAAQQAAADRKASFGTQQGMYKPGSEGWWSAHDNRAGQLQAGREGRQRAAIGGMSHDERRDQLLANRANRHEIALANIGVKGHMDPRRDPNSAMNSGNPFGPKDPGNPVRMGGLKAMVNPFSQLPGMFNKAGQNSTLGLAGGLTAHVSKVQAAGASLAGAGHAGYKKKDRQSSPSAEWAAMGANSVAGVPIGFAAGVPGAVSTMSASATAMSMALAGPLSDYGLQAGQTYAQSFIDGSSRQIKTAGYSALGLPTNISPEAQEFLAATGLERAGSGASTTKTASGGVGTVVLPPATPTKIVLQFPEQHIQIGDQVVATIAQREIEAAFDQATNTYKTL